MNDQAPLTDEAFANAHLDLAIARNEGLIELAGWAERWGTRLIAELRRQRAERKMSEQQITREA